MERPTVELAVRGLVRSDRIKGVRPSPGIFIEAELEEGWRGPRYRHRSKAGDVPSEGPVAVSGHRHVGD